jgi:hypothetical protein
MQNADQDKKERAKSIKLLVARWLLKHESKEKKAVPLSKSTQAKSLGR